MKHDKSCKEGKILKRGKGDANSKAIQEKNIYRKRREDTKDPQTKHHYIISKVTEEIWGVKIWGWLKKSSLKKESKNMELLMKPLYLLQRHDQVVRIIH